MTDVTATETVQVPGLLPIFVCCALLLGRTVVVGQGGMTMAFLVIVYIGILAISRPAAGSFTYRSLLPLILGIAAVLTTRLMFSGPFSWRSTSAGVGVSVLAAVAEEGLFRGLLFARLSHRGANLAIVVSAVLFAFVHLPFYGPAAFPLDLGAGLLFAWQRSDSGNWVVPACTHSLANLLAVLP